MGTGPDWGSEEGFFRRYAPAAYNLALRLCGRPADAEDVSQEALIRALKALPHFKGKSDPRSWVYRITVNVWKNRVRAEKSRPFWKAIPLFGSDDGPSVDRPDGAPPVDRALEASELEAAVQKALAELDDDDRAVVVLKDMDDMTYAQVAEVLGVPEGTVKSRLSRARERLRARLAPKDAESPK